MTGSSARLLPVLVLLLAGGAVALAQQFPAFDPERIFMLGDADLDGRLSLDEFRELFRTSPRMKNAPAGTIERLFRRLDTDRDGFLSLGEYRKSFPARPRGTTVKRGPAKEKPADAGDAGISATPQTGISPSRTKFFESKIRPVLVTHCGKCHAGTAEKLRRGASIRQPRSCPPWRRHRPRDRTRPPRREPAHPGDPLPRRGAPDASQGETPRRGHRRLRGLGQDGGARPKDATRRTSRLVLRPISAKGREFWSFRPPKEVQPPQVKRVRLDPRCHRPLPPRGARSPRARPRRRRRPVEAPAPGDVRPHRAPAHARGARRLPRGQLARRLAQVVDRLLASPRFGERWGRHWLDVARFAESSGKTNLTYPQAWRYRDWVIASFNADKPYDQFVREQIAGDLLPAEDDRQRAEQLIATGFLAIGSKAHDAENRGQFLLDLVDEQIEATTRAFLGLTVACARCHDHKMDPISQRDYYALSGIFRSTQTCSGTLAGRLPELQRVAADRAACRRGRARRPCPRSRPSRGPRWKSASPPWSASATPSPRARRTRDRLRRANSMLAIAPLSPGHRPSRRSASRVRDGSPRAGRGRRQPALRARRARPARAVVPRGLVRVLCARADRADRVGQRPARAGRLARLAREPADRPGDRQPGLAAPVRPRAGRDARQLRRRRPAPSHPELLDTLAVDFMDDGWSIKRLIRRIVLSRAYSLDSAHDQRQLRGRPRQRARLADEQAAAGGRGGARCLAVRRRPARAPSRRSGRRWPGRARGWPVSLRVAGLDVSGHAPGGLPAGGPRPECSSRSPCSTSPTRAWSRANGRRRPARPRRSTS